MKLHPDLSGLLTDLGGIFDPGTRPQAPYPRQHQTRPGRCLAISRMALPGKVVSDLLGEKDPS